MNIAVGKAVVLLACLAAASSPPQARSVISLPLAKTLHEALVLMDDFKGSAEEFRIAIPEEVFDPGGVAESTFLKQASTHGWTLDRLVKSGGFRIYRFREANSQLDKATKNSGTNRQLRGTESRMTPNKSLERTRDG